MFNSRRKEMFDAYEKARSHFLKHPEALLDIEKKVHDLVILCLKENLNEVIADYNEASLLYPFWQHYPPEERGRAPRGDQFPWIEVGEHSVGFKLTRILSTRLPIREIGLPSGTDQRYLIKLPIFMRESQITQWAMVFQDVKSVGPRDDADHTVLSTNQVSGDGIWDDPLKGVKNSTMRAVGDRASHPFHCTLPPLYVLSSGLIAPTVSVFIKPVYEMLSLNPRPPLKAGQPLRRLTVATLPNGLLLTQNPGYLKARPSLFYPGKDDKGKDETRLRARVSFRILREIAPWRVESIDAG